ncbi:hypothetical protein QBC35DRAFT_550617 [Podospora australis]|uniref:Glycan binding protein Y3-like domain-containing protein n=1 Tax=Podospora australis TaxID=1536484 RepID=A0AAN7AJA0_9PEZI|nr:hypothetical protein QBC35DRAFT_550617 [Podospora australis]
MKPSTILVAITSLALSTAAAPTADPAPNAGHVNTIQKRGCFSTGATWGSDQNTALNKAREICDGFFEGTWQKRESHMRCFQLSANKHVKFTVGLMGPNAGATRYLGSDECYGGLISEIVKCSRGGETTYGNWRYRADPNDGQC